MNRQRIDSHRLEDGDELQVGKYKLTYLARGDRGRRPLTEAPLPAPRRGRGAAGKSLTIGAVCKALSQEFPDISISKIRYLEDQKLLHAAAHAGRLPALLADDVSRLRTILRLQRDEFLPLRVIRQELAAGRTEDETPPAPAADAAPEAGRPAPRCAG